MSNVEIPWERSFLEINSIDINYEYSRFRDDDIRKAGLNNLGNKSVQKSSKVSYKLVP